MPQSPIKYSPRRTFFKIFIWVIFVVLILGAYSLHSEWFDIGFLADFVEDNHLLIAIIYVLILSSLGLFFIPSTPFAVAGVLIFSPVEAYALNLVGIITSSTIVYYFSQYLRLDEVFHARYPQQLKRVKKALNKRELPIIVGWSFFPVVPTDLIIYVSSVLRIPFKKCLLGVCIGEGCLNLIYIGLAAGLMSF